MRHLLLAAFLLFPAVAGADSKPDPRDIPVPAPAGCIEPVEGGITSWITRGPKTVRTYRLANGKSLDTPRLRLKAYGRFIPERLGSTKGEVMASFEAQLLPDIFRDGVNPDNSKFDAAPGVLRIANYRVSLRTVSKKPLAYDVTVEDIGCPEEAIVPPLTAGQTHTFWMSTDGVIKVSFANGRRYMSGDTLQATLSTDLAPDVHQTDKTNPSGYAMLHLFESRDGAPASKEWTNQDLAGAKATLLDYQVEVVRVVWGKDTRLAQTQWVIQLLTKGAPPAASVLVKVTRLQVTPRPY